MTTNTNQIVATNLHNINGVEVVNVVAENEHGGIAIMAEDCSWQVGVQFSKNVGASDICIENGSGMIAMYGNSSDALLEEGNVIWDSNKMGDGWKFLAREFQMREIAFTNMFVNAFDNGMTIHNMGNHALLATLDGYNVKACNMYVSGAGASVRYMDKNGNAVRGQVQAPSVNTVVKSVYSLDDLKAHFGGTLNIRHFDETEEMLAYEVDGSLLYFASDELVENCENLSYVKVRIIDDAQKSTIHRNFSPVRGTQDKFELVGKHHRIVIDFGTISDHNPFNLRVEDVYGNELDHNGDIIPFFAKWTILHKNSLVPPTHRRPIKYRRGCDFTIVQPMRYVVMKK